MEDNLKCPKCESKTIRTRISRNDRVCTKCGHVWDMNGSKEKTS